MLRSMRDMEGFLISATDGMIGRVTDFYVDDHAWVIRYLVVGVGDSLPRRKVLISPIAVNLPNWQEKRLPVALTRLQVANSPAVDTDKPVSRQEEAGYLGYYGYGTYWGGGGLWGAGLYPDILQGGLQRNAADSRNAGGRKEDPHLRSGNALLRYYVHATDGDIGHVDGMLLDDRTWAIRYLIVNTSNWWLGHRVLIAPQWMSYVSWPESTVSLAMTREQVQSAPAYDAANVLAREQEAAVHHHYGRPGYWIDEERQAR